VLLLLLLLLGASPYASRSLITMVLESAYHQSYLPYLVPSYQLIISRAVFCTSVHQYIHR